MVGNGGSRGQESICPKHYVQTLSFQTILKSQNILVQLKKMDERGSRMALGCIVHPSAVSSSLLSFVSVFKEHLKCTAQGFPVSPPYSVIICLFRGGSAIYVLENLMSQLSSWNICWKDGWLHFHLYLWFLIIHSNGVEIGEEHWRVKPTNH